MSKAKKYLAAFLASVITVSLVVIPGAAGVSAATADDLVTEETNGQQGYVSFLEKEPNFDPNANDIAGATLTTQSTTNNYVFLKQLDLKVTDTAFNAGEKSFWFDADWNEKYSDLSQITNNGFVELWVKSSAAVEFEVRLSKYYGYYTYTVKVEQTGSWQKLKLNFANFKAEEYAKESLLSSLVGIKVVFGENTLNVGDEISLGSMKFYTDNTVDNGYVRVNEGALSFEYNNVGTAANVSYSAGGEKFNYSKKLTFTASSALNGKAFDIKIPTVTLGATDYISFWARSSSPIATKYSPMDSNWVWAFSPAHLQNLGGDGVWKEYRVYGSEVSNISNVQRLRFYPQIGSLTEGTEYSIEFSGFAVYSKLEPNNNIYQSVPEKSISQILLGGNASGNAYLYKTEVNDNSVAFDTAYQVAVKDDAFYTKNNWQGAYFIYSDNWGNANLNISKITTDGYIKTYIKTERPIKLLFSAYGEGYKFSKDIPVYISGSPDWQEILIPISRFTPNADGTLPRGDGSGGDSDIPLNKIMGFRWRVIQNDRVFLNTAEFDDNGNYVSGDTAFFGPIDFVRMVHADLDNSRNLDTKDLVLMRKALIGSTDIETASGDANADGSFNILDLIHLKKLLVEMTPISIDMTNTHTCGNGNGILVSDKNKTLPDDTVINAFRNTADTGFGSVYSSATLLDSLCIEAVSNNENGEAEVVSPTGSVVIQIPVGYLYTSKGVNLRNIASVKAAVKYNGGCKPAAVSHDSKYVYVTTDVLGDICFYTGDTVSATTVNGTSDLRVVLSEDHPGVTGYDAVYSAKAYMNGAEIANPAFSTDISEIKVSGNTVTVPASFKDNTTTDGVKLTVTAGDEKEKVIAKRHTIQPWRDDKTKVDGVMTAASGNVTDAPDGSSDFGKYYSITVGENFYTLNYEAANRIYMITDWAGNYDFSTLAVENSALRLWVKTPHSATFTVTLLNGAYVAVGSATVTTANDKTDWQAIDIPAADLNIKDDTDLTKILGVKLSPAGSAESFLSTGETFTFGAIDLMTPADVTAYYPLMIKNWKTVVTDDFDGDALNGNIWNVFNGKGTEHNTGAAANYNANALSVSNGNLVMKVVKEADGTFSIPRINTKGKYGQTFGLFSAKIKTPKNTKAGVNTAFWLLPSSGSWGEAFIGKMGGLSVGEVDILETSPAWTGRNAQTAIHTWNKDGSKTETGNEKSLTNANISSETGYVDVSCVWTENALYFYYDGKLVRKETVKSNHNEKVYPILSMSIAGYNGTETWLGKFTDADVPNLVSYVDCFSISK